MNNFWLFPPMWWNPIQWDPEEPKACVLSNIVKNIVKNSKWSENLCQIYLFKCFQHILQVGNEVYEERSMKMGLLNVFVFVIAFVFVFASVFSLISFTPSPLLRPFPKSVTRCIRRGTAKGPAPTTRMLLQHVMMKKTKTKTKTKTL